MDRLILASSLLRLVMERTPRLPLSSGYPNWQSLVATAPAWAGATSHSFGTLLFQIGTIGNTPSWGSVDSGASLMHHFDPGPAKPNHGHQVRRMTRKPRLRKVMSRELFRRALSK